jgi:hypothetical protein
MATSSERAEVLSFNSERDGGEPLLGARRIRSIARCCEIDELSDLGKVWLPEPGPQHEKGFGSPVPSLLSVFLIRLYQGRKRNSDAARRKIVSVNTSERVIAS